jgi:4a-hydroxytetrahydrobiopterin dehydratase
VAPRDEILTPGQLRVRLAGLEGWRGDTAGISKDYSIGYDAAIGMVAEIGRAAVELEHRPDLDIRWDRLRVFMTTHTAGDVVTELDFLLASRIDRIAVAHGAQAVSMQS